MLKLHNLDPPQPIKLKNRCFSKTV